MKKILWYVLVSVLLVMACSQAFAEVAVPSGYTKLNGGYMVEKKASTSYDLRGLYNNEYIQTTYDDTGYQYYKDPDSIGNGVVTTSVESVSATDGRFARLIYTVTAGSARITNGKLAVHADVQIGSDDYAPIEVIKNGTDVIGISMKNSKNNAQFSLYFRDAIGVTNSDTYWFGDYSSRKTYAFETLSTSNKQGTYKDGLDKLVETDSGFAVSW